MGWFRPRTDLSLQMTVVCANALENNANCNDIEWYVESSYRDGDGFASIESPRTRPSQCSTATPRPTHSAAGLHNADAVAYCPLVGDVRWHQLATNALNLSVPMAT